MLRKLVAAVLSATLVGACLPAPLTFPTPDLSPVGEAVFQGMGSMGSSSSDRKMTKNEKLTLLAIGGVLTAMLGGAMMIAPPGEDTTETEARLAGGGVAFAGVGMTVVAALLWEGDVLGPELAARVRLLARGGNCRLMERALGELAAADPKLAGAVSEEDRVATCLGILRSELGATE
jgi:hypothetical protein